MFSFNSTVLRNIILKIIIKPKMVLRSVTVICSRMLAEPCCMMAKGIANDDKADAAIMCSSDFMNYPMCDRYYVNGSQDVVWLILFGSS